MNIPYIRSGDYLIPDLKLPEETRPIGKWGRMHRDYLKEYHPVQFNNLVLSGNLWAYLADLNEQAQQRRETLLAQKLNHLSRVVGGTAKSFSKAERQKL